MNKDKVICFAGKIVNFKEWMVSINGVGRFVRFYGNMTIDEIYERGGGSCYKRKCSLYDRY